MKALFVSIDDIKRNTALSGNIDNDKLVQFINIAQDIKIQDYLGTNLYERLQEGVIADNLNSDESDLIDTYIAPMLIHWGTAEAIPFLSYHFGNAGIYKHGAEGSVNVEKNEIDFLIQKERNIAEYYTDRFIDYMRYNYSKFPQYTNNVDDDLDPLKDIDTSSGWVL